MAIDFLSRETLILSSTAILIIIGFFLLIRVRKSRNNHQPKKENALDVSGIADITKDEFKPARFQMATQDAIPQEKKETLPSAKPTPSVLKAGEEGRFVENPESKAPVKTPEPQSGVPEGSVIAKNPESKAPVKAPEPQSGVPERSVIAKNPKPKAPVNAPELQSGVPEGSVIGKNPGSKALVNAPEPQSGVPEGSVIGKNPGSKAPVKTPEPQSGVPEESVIAKNPGSKAPVKAPELQSGVPEGSVIGKNPGSKKPATLSEFKPEIQEKGLKLEDEITEMEEIPRKKVSNKKAVKKETEAVIEDIEKGTKILTKRKGSKKTKQIKKTPKAIRDNIIEEETGEKIKKRSGTKKKASVQKESTG